MKVCESVGRRCKACGETPEIRNPNKHTGFDKFKKLEVWFDVLCTPFHGHLDGE